MVNLMQTREPGPLQLGLVFAKCSALLQVKSEVGGCHLTLWTASFSR